MTNPQETAVTGIELVNTATDDTGPRLERVNIMASGEMLEWLDSVSSTMYRKTGVRGLSLRNPTGICGAFADHKPQFTGRHSEAHIRTVVGRLFEAYARAGSPGNAADVNPGPVRPLKPPLKPGELDDYLERHAAATNTAGARPVNPNLPQSVNGRLR